MKHRDALNIEYSELATQLSGINPNVSTYKKVKDRMEEIRKELDGLVLMVKIKKTVRGKGKSKRYIAPYQNVH